MTYYIKFFMSKFIFLWRKVWPGFWSGFALILLRIQVKMLWYKRADGILFCVNISRNLSDIRFNHGTSPLIEKPRNLAIIFVMFIEYILFNRFYRDVFGHYCWSSWEPLRWIRITVYVYQYGYACVIPYTLVYPKDIVQIFHTFDNAQ